ncbi:hypothetical protein SOVF_016020 isoform A [Spinacia oleracea]|nr:hypothetical protein SOVF_016020 isoform A [Spinacia oleracea]
MEPMEISTPGHAGFATQADALLRKSFTYQKRNKSQNCCLLITPLVIIGFFAFVEHYLKQMSAQRGGAVVEIKKPAPWPPALNIPSNTTRAVSSKYMPFPDLPSPSCRVSGNCPATFLLTGTNQSFVMTIAEKMFPPVSTEDPSDMDRLVLATSVPLFQPNYLVDAAFEPDSPSPLYYLQSKCKANASIPYPTRKAFDFQNTNKANFNVTLWNEPSTDADILGSSTFTRLPRLVNLASNAYLQVLQGSDTQLLFEFIKEVPTIFSINASVSKTVDFFLRIASFGLLLFPVTVLLSSIVYEKEKKLRIMMKMHGLRDTAYWAITYIYCLMVSLLFVQFFLIAGKLSGLYFFTKNGYTLQSMFYFLHVNWQISFAFLISTLVSTVKTAQVVGSTFMMLICIFSFFIASRVIESTAFSGSFVVLVEMFPGFALYRGVYEFQKYATFAKNGAGVGMQWQNLNDPGNGIKKAMVIMITEWKIMLSLAYYLDQVLSSGSGRRRSPLFFLHCLRRKPSSQEQYLQRNSSQLFPSNDHSDVAQERQKVEQLMQEGSTSYTAICDNIKKIYPGRDGNPAKAAVRGLSLALGRSECFGMLGPNGAGKTSFISMMIGLTEPTSGTAYVEGLDITTCMNNVYTCMGVCPQFDLLWETLTGREHLYFYGRLKNLRGPVLKRAVEEALKDVNLFHGGVADKHAGKYSGGMKRRLSVAISLIGNPKIVYLDEPSTGLDPASRNSLWNVVKRAKKNRAILLTSKMNDLFSNSFKRYANLKDQAQRDDLELGSQTGANLDKFFEDVDGVKGDMGNVDKLYKRLQEANEECKIATNAKAVKDLRARMDIDVEQVLKRVKIIKGKLEALDRSNVAHRNLPGCGPGSSADRTRTSVVSGLGKKLKDMMDNFQTLRSKMSAEYKETVERRYFTITGEKAEEETIEKLIESGESESFLQKAIQQQGRGQIMDTVKEIQERHDAIKEIEKNLLELHQVFLDMAALVEAQGQQLNDIASNVNRASSFVSHGANELVVAKDHQKNSRKWTCIAIILGVILVIVILFPILYSTLLVPPHSMEEAEALCDRLGVFVDGALCCIGNPKELKARYGGYFLFTMTTTQSNDTEVENMVLSLCNNAQKTYHLGGTQKFELPKHEVRLADIFQLVEDAKSKFPVQAWALADTTLEDVFIKVTRQAQATSSDE